MAVPGQRVNDHWIRLREDLTPVRKEATAGAPERLCLPAVGERVVRGLTFGDAPVPLGRGDPVRPFGRRGLGGHRSPEPARFSFEAGRASRP